MENKEKQKIETPMKQNLMRKVKIEKVVLSVSGVGDDLEKGLKLLEILTKRKIMKTKAKKRIPTLGVRPGLEIGGVVTIRKGYKEILKRMLAAIDNQLKKKQISENNFSFGIREYIEIPGVEYHRDIGIRGLDVTVVFKRTGRRVKLKKVNRGRIPARQKIRKEEIIKFMEENFQVAFK